MFQQHLDYSSDAQHKASPLMLNPQTEIQINSYLRSAPPLCTAGFIPNQVLPGQTRLINTAKTRKEPGASLNISAQAPTNQRVCRFLSYVQCSQVEIGTNQEVGGLTLDPCFCDSFSACLPGYKQFWRKPALAFSAWTQRDPYIFPIFQPWDNITHWYRIRKHTDTHSLYLIGCVWGVKNQGHLEFTEYNWLNYRCTFYYFYSHIF